MSKDLSDRELSLVCFGIGFFVSFSFTRFGLSSYIPSGMAGHTMTSSLIASSFWIDVLIFCLGWFSILLFMWNVPHLLKKR